MHDATDPAAAPPLTANGVLASYRLLAYRDGVVWFAGKGHWANWASLVFGADTTGDLVACRMALT